MGTNVEKWMSRTSARYTRLLGLQNCAVDCNGHFRSLQYLREIANTHQPTDYDGMTDAMATRLSRWFSLDELPVSVITAALRGDRMKGNMYPDGSDKTYLQLVTTGIYLNTFDGRVEHFVPRMAPLFIRIWIRGRECGHPQSFETTLTRALRDVFELEPSVEYCRYGLFHAQFENLKRLVTGDTILTLSSWYGDYSSLVNPEKAIMYTAKKDVSIRSGVFSELVHRNRFSTDLQQRIQVFSRSNPGFDVLIGDETDSGERIVTCIDCRSAYPGAATALTTVGIAAQRRRTVAAVGRHLGEYSLPAAAENVYFVVCAYQDNLPRIELPEQTALLTKASLEWWYSPTFASRPEYLLIAQANADK